MTHIRPETNTVSLLSEAASLLDGAPLVNGLVWPAAPVLSEERCGRLWLGWRGPQGEQFSLAAWQEDGFTWLQYTASDLPADFPLDSFGLRFAAIDNLRQYLCSGYYSWDSSLYVEPAALAALPPDKPRPATGYAFTQLLPTAGEGSLVLGFDRHDRFQHTFTFDTQAVPTALTILTLWDGKPVPAEGAVSERLVVFQHPGVYEALQVWARLVAAAAAPGPRLSLAPITGWCSWYNLYAQITETNVLEHLQHTAAVVQHHQLPMRVFQIDDGFTPEMGDWLEVRPQFPHGMPYLMDEIRRAGFTPGLWIAPFMVGNRSHLYQHHPDWVVQDRHTGGPLVQMEFYGEFRWHKRSEEYYILDTTHPDALAYLRQVFHTWRYEWGCEYFKTDFMHFGAAHGPDRAVWHTPGLSRIEIWRQTAEMIRNTIGDALWLGCGFPLWAAVGLVDAVRIGRDVGVDWNGAMPAGLLLTNLAVRSFANHILWQADPDCVLLRQRFHHLSEVELSALARFTGMLGGVTLTSDDLLELTPERLALWEEILPTTIQACRFPRLGQSSITYQDGQPALDDPLLVIERSLSSGHQQVFLLNTGDAPITCTDFWKPVLLAPHQGVVLSR